MKKAEKKLEWYGDHGFFPADPRGVYGADYFAKYEGYALTERGVALNKARLALCRYYCPDMDVLDVGIGSGQFIEGRREERPDLLVKGFDVNPVAIRWLEQRGLYLDPYVDRLEVPAMTFWDSLEHIESPEVILAHCSRFVLMSIPIFTDRAHVLRSRHFRPDEHYWYFTAQGLVKWMDFQGLALRNQNEVETHLGREGVGSFVFERVRPA